MWSLQDLPLRKPACSLRMSFSRVAVKCSSMTLLNTLLVRLKWVILLLLRQISISLFRKLHNQTSLLKTVEVVWRMQYCWNQIDNYPAVRRQAWPLTPDSRFSLDQKEIGCYTAWARILSDRYIFCTLRRGKTTAGYNVPGAFLVRVIIDWLSPRLENVAANNM